MSGIKSAHDQFLESPEHQRLFEQERLLVEAAELLTEILENRKVTRAQLAQRLRKSKAFITQVLRGNHNMTLRTLADLFGALDLRIVMNAEPRAKRLSDTTSAIREDFWQCFEVPGPYVLAGRFVLPPHALQGVAPRRAPQHDATEEAMSNQVAA